MIQRIQTVYLFLAAVITALIFLFPFASYNDGVSVYKLGILGFTNLTDNLILFNVVPVALLVISTLVLTVITIFMFKKRMLQIRLSRISIFIYLVLIGVIFYYSDRAVSELNGDKITFQYGFGAIAPIIALLLTYLAIRGIKKDEALVRSADRIR
jgi:uncharacterized membrane protein (DUF485 family)